MSDFTSLENGLLAIKDQFEDIIKHFDREATFTLDLEVKLNEFGGNPTPIVFFTYKTRCFDGKPKHFEWHLALQTGTGFLNEIKAYLLDCVDAFVNLM